MVLRRPLGFGCLKHDSISSFTLAWEPVRRAPLFLTLLLLVSWWSWTSWLFLASCEDFFRGQVVNEVALAGLDHCMVCTAAADKVYLRHYHIGFQRSGSKVL